MFFWKKKKEDTNNDMISLVNIPILIKNHEHPLLFCITKRTGEWLCNKCHSNFKCDIPSFYCTYCNYDLCQKCLGKKKLNQIKKYNENLSTFSNIKDDKKASFDWQIKFPKHNHLLSSIKRSNNYTWIYKDCKKEYNEKFYSYYCSLCDYDLCEECFEKSKNPSIANIANILPGKNGNDSYGTNSTNITKPLQGKNGNDSCGANSTSCENSDTDDDDKDEDEEEYKESFRRRKIKKPVIYLYPENEMDISVQLDLDLSKSKFTTIYPKFNKENNIWNVHAKPNGDIQLKEKTYPYLFWEADSYFSEEMKEGFIVKGENAEAFLEEKLKLLGLNDKESTDFITFWLPVLLKNKLSLCSFQSKKFFDNIKLNVTPKPETMIRIFLCIKKIDAPIDIKEQNLEKNERKGFTVIEWGRLDF